jgi:short-subunit dehydrogenase
MHIVVTGASSGIGQALARELATLSGARLTLVSRRADRLAEVARELSCPAHFIARDLSSTGGVEDFLDAAEAVHGPVDVLVNNAGSQVLADTSRVDVDEGEASLRLNLMTPLRLTRRVLPGMLARRSGAIVDITSLAALAPTPRMTYYNASKAGLAAASEALRGELRGTGVRVLTVYPGIIDETQLAQAALARYESSALLRLQPRGSSAELARRVRRSLERGDARLIYPRVNALVRWFPGITRWMMDRFTPALRPLSLSAP